MRLSISNIAWPYSENEVYLKIVKDLGCSAIEIAPSRIWPEPVKSTLSERISFANSVKKQGLGISALHALLYNRPDLGIFKGKEVESKTIEYLKELCQLAKDIGAKILVFGSPNCRKKGDIPMDEAFEKAAGFFSKVAHPAADLGVCVCIEPLGKKEADFINTSNDGLKLVDMVNSAGFRLHLDAKAISEEKNDFLGIFEKTLPYLRHFHINDAGLDEINSTKTVDHAAISKALRAVKYDNYVSIEMRMLEDYRNVIQRSIEYAKKTYIM